MSHPSSTVRVEVPGPGHNNGGSGLLVRLTNGRTLVLEIKGVDSEQNKAKRDALDLWVRGVNAHGGVGVWSWDVAFEMAQIRDILSKHAL